MSGVGQISGLRAPLSKPRVLVMPGQTNVVVRGVGRHANSPILWVRIHGSFDDIMDREPAIKSIGRAENADTAWARLEEFEIERGQALSGDRSGLRVRSLGLGPVPRPL